MIGLGLNRFLEVVTLLWVCLLSNMQGQLLVVLLIVEVLFNNYALGFDLKDLNL